MVLDEVERVDEILKLAMPWDVMGGLVRRARARNPNSIKTTIHINKEDKGINHITIPFITREYLVGDLVNKAFSM